MAVTEGNCDLGSRVLRPRHPNPWCLKTRRHVAYGQPVVPVQLLLAALGTVTALSRRETTPARVEVSSFGFTATDVYDVA